MEKDAPKKMEELEAEIIQMQMHMAHQESLLQNLNEVLIEQQKELDSLRKEQKELREYLHFLLESKHAQLP